MKLTRPSHFLYKCIHVFNIHNSLQKNEKLHNCLSSRYNDCWYVGSQAVEDIHNRACYDGYPDVMLVTNAIRNSSSSGPSGMKTITHQPIYIRHHDDLNLRRFIVASGFHHPQ